MYVDRQSTLLEREVNIFYLDISDKLNEMKEGEKSSRLEMLDEASLTRQPEEVSSAVWRSCTSLCESGVDCNNVDLTRHRLSKNPD